MTPSTPAVILSEAEHRERMARAKPDYMRQIGAACALIVGILCLLAQMYRIQKSVDASAMARPSPISYEGSFIPEKPFFRPGEDATFNFVRTADFDGPELFVQGLGTFENNDTGVSYSTGQTLKRLRTKDQGRHPGITVKTIPTNAKPGKHYTYEGQITAQGAYRTLPVGFTSQPFEIRNWGSEQEKAQYDEKQAALRRVSSVLLDDRLAQVRE